MHILFFGILIVFLFGGILSSTYGADGRLPNTWDKNIEKVTVLQKPVDGDSVQIIKTLVLANFIPIIKYIFIGIALIVFGMYSYLMVLGGTGDEEQLTEQRKNFLFAAIGCTIIGIASQVVEVFDPFRSGSNNEIIDIDQAKNITQILINYIELSLAAIAIAVIFYAGFRMITANGDEERMNEGKNLFKYGFIGFVIVMLADPMVNMVFFPNSGQSGVGNQEATNFIVQGLGVLKFVLTFLGILVFISFVIAGVLYFTALDDDDRTERAKRTIIWTAIGFVVIVISYSLVTFFLGKSI